MSPEESVRSVIACVKREISILVRSTDASEDFLDGVLLRQDLKRAQELLTQTFGLPVKAFDAPVRLDRNTNSMIRALGGIRQDQCLFLIQQEGSAVGGYAMLWPWASDPQRVTLKVGICAHSSPKLSQGKGQTRQSSGTALKADAGSLSQPMRFYRLWLTRLGIGIVSLAVAAAIGEVGFRLFWIKHATIGSGIDDPHFHHRLKGLQTYHFETSEFNVDIRTNRWGLRGTEPVLPKPKGLTRILMLGDSYTFGFPVRDEETFSYLIEQGLKQQGYSVDVVNGGVSGYSPTLHYLSLRDQFLTFEPDEVILWFDLGDVQEDHWFQKNLLYDTSGRITRCDPRYVHGRFDYREWLRNHSALAKYFDTKILRTFSKIQILGLWPYIQTILRGERAKVAIARLKQAQGSPDLAEYDRFLLVRESSTQTSLKPYWALTARYINRIHDLLKERHIPLMIGIYPYGMLAGPNQWAQGRLAWGFEPGKTYEADAALALLSQFSATSGIPLVSTFDSFRGAAASRKLFYDWDGHLTPDGHQVIATHLLNDSRFLALLHQLQNRARNAGGSVRESGG